MEPLSIPGGSGARRWAALLVAMAFLVAGCGGSESEEAERTTSTRAEATTGDGQAPSKQEYLAQGDAICAELQADAAGLAQRAQELQAQSDELSKAEFLARAADFWQDQIRVTEGFLERFEELGSPTGDEAQVEQFLKSIEDGIATAREIRQSLARGEEVPQALIERYGRAVVRGNTLARAYGFQVCGQSQ